MFLHVDVDNGRAVYDQIVRQVKFALAAGAVAPGEMIPSVRELARDLAINPNTVARAYRQLQDEGLVEAVRGEGLAVVVGAAKACREQRKQLLGQRLREALDEALSAGLEPREVQDLVTAELKRLTRK